MRIGHPAHVGLPLRVRSSTGVTATLMRARGDAGAVLRRAARRRSGSGMKIAAEKLRHGRARTWACPRISS